MLVYARVIDVIKTETVYVKKHERSTRHACTYSVRDGRVYENTRA